MEIVEEKLREEARKLLIAKKVDVIIGYEMGTLPLTTSPCFITAPEEAGRLVYNPLCVQNLAKFVTDILYGHRESQRRLKNEERTNKVVGIVARGCTARSLAIHMQEKQYLRDEVVILGVPCRGYVDPAKITVQLGGQEIREGEIEGDKLLVETPGGKSELPIAGVLADNCLTCRFNNPLLYDVMVGEEAPPMDAGGEYAGVEEFSKLAAKERWDYFVKETNKCIRCYACRNACPSCYCKSCFVEQTQPQWIGLGVNSSDNEAFQIMRLYHMAGRCVDCGSCIAACPMRVDLRKYLKKLESDGWRFFGHRAGVSTDEPALLGTFKETDGQDFIFEPK